MKKILICIFLLFISFNSANSACVLTGGACSIDSIREDNKKETLKKNLRNSEIKKNKNNKKLLKIKKIKKEYGKKQDRIL